jgi:hypothetical protein
VLNNLIILSVSKGVQEVVTFVSTTVRVNKTKPIESATDEIRTSCYALLREIGL